MTRPLARRVFVVEDEALVAMELKDHLIDLGFEVCGHATRGETALAAIPAAGPDLVLMDINLGRGRMNGIEVAERLRGVVDIPVVFVTAYSDPELAAHAARTESFGYVVKPFQVQALRANVDMALLRHETSRRVRESEQRFRALFEQAAVGVAEVDSTTGRFLRANRKYAGILGYSLQELLDLDVASVAHPDDRRLTTDNVDRLRSGVLREHSFETRCVRKDGEVVWLRASISALWAPGEAPTRHIAVVDDVTDRRRAEEARAASEARLAGVIAIAKDAIISTDDEGRVVIFNEGAEEIFGWRREEILGRPMDVLLPPGLREAHRQHLGRFASGAEKARSMGDRPTLTGVRKDGEEFPAEAAISRLDVAGKPLFTVVLRDITERRRREQELRESEARYRSLFEGTIEGVFRTTLDGTVVDVNPAFARMLGYERPSELVGMRTEHLFVDDDERRRSEDAQRHQDTFRGIEARWQRKDGSVVVVELSGRLLLDAHGEPSHFQGLVRDLTEQRERDRRVEHLLEHSEQLELVLEGTRLGFWDWNPKKGLVLFNARWAEMFGCRHDQVEPTVESWIERVHPDDREARAEALRAHVDGRLPHYECVYRMRHEDGRWLTVLDRGRIFARDEHGDPTRFCGTHTDITAEKEAERSAIEANRAKTHFLANMSHELRTPLNAILGLSEALLEKTYGELTGRQERSLRTIRDAGQHLRDLIEDVLDIARVEAGKLPLSPGEIALAPFVGECVALVRDMADARQQPIVVEIAPDVVALRADRRRLKQVLVNLLTNAVKFGAKSAPITLGARVRPEAGSVDLWVSNAGVGIAEEERERIFEPFVTLDQELSREQHGAGLGLALVKRLVELHRGSVLVESEPGAGATFIVRLPWAAGDEAHAAALARTEATRADAAEFAPPAHGRRVLLVEDNDANVLAVESYLDAKGYEVTVVRDGLTAVTATALGRFDVIVMDIQLPLLDGLEAIRRIRAAERGRRPIVALTALAMPGDAEACLAAGATAYVPKPVGLPTLARTLEELVARPTSESP